jgi:hypothetical protein
LRLRRWLGPTLAWSGRPVALVALGRDNSQVWDLALGTPVGPVLPVGVPGTKSLGALHGRPVLVSVAGVTVHVWDVLTGVTVHTVEMTQPPLATSTGPFGALYAVTGDGAVTVSSVPLRAVHPLARRSRS